MVDRDLNPFINDEFDLTKRMIFSQMNSKSNCSIAYITAINSSPVSVNVQPSIKYFDKIEGFQTPEVLENIPVAQIANNNASIRMPLNVGDVGILLWFDREVYSWLLATSLSPSSPDSGNLFNESACIFIPLVQKFAIAPQIKNTGVDFISSEISLLTQLINLLTDLTTFCNAIVSAPTTNPLTPTYAAALATAATNLSVSIATLSTALTTFKGAQ